MLDIQKINSKKVGFFRFKELNGRYLITNDPGNFVLLDKEEFQKFIEGKTNANDKVYPQLHDGGFLKDDILLKRLIRKYRSKNIFLGRGTSLHIVVVTLRCNFTCSYCQTSSENIKRTDLDMDIPTARKVVDFIFQSPSDTITIEFQGGEPLLNWDTVSFIIDYALVKNEVAGKNMVITIVSNFSLMDDEKIEFLIERGVSVCCSIDGPAHVHNKNRGDNHARVVRYMKNAYEKYQQKYDRYMPGCLTTVTRHSLPYVKEIIDEMRDLGLDHIHLRSVNSIGIAKKKWEDLGVSPAQFARFYQDGLDYIIDLNKNGIDFKERSAWIFLIKILTDDDPNFLDIRSPCGATIGQMAYDYNGDIYPCDEARMVGMMGDKIFRLGNVLESSYSEIIESDTTRSLCIASTLDGIPGCSTCVYKPYCGVCPVQNYVDDGNIFSQHSNNRRCEINRSILDYLFEKLHDNECKEIFSKWAFGQSHP